MFSINFLSHIVMYDNLLQVNWYSNVHYCNNLLFCLDRWHTFPPPKDVLIMSLSSSACEMMLFLKGRLQILQEQLAGSIFNLLWKDLSQALNKFIFEEVNNNIIVQHYYRKCIIILR